MDGQTSSSVIITDMTDDITNKPESNKNLTANPLSTSGVVSDVENEVPVTPLITVPSEGTTFDVITSEQLRLSSGGSLRPILCVDNSCMCENGHKVNDSSHLNSQWLENNGSLKTAHIVIENNETLVPNSASWLEVASLPVLPIKCKNTTAQLYKSKFGSGGRGKCIKLGNKWYTPTEFEAVCGRGSSKEWKRSIRFGGKSLGSLIDEGILQLHAIVCTCAVCCDDEKETGPIRWYIPYKRKKIKILETNGSLDSNEKLKLDGKEESNDEKSCDSNNELDGEQMTVSLDPNNVNSTLAKNVSENNSLGNFLEESLPQPGSISLAESFNRLDKMASKLVKIVFELRREVEEAKAQWKEEKEQLQVECKRDREQAVLTATVEAQVAYSRAVFNSTVHVVDPIATVNIQPSEDSNDNKKCANCNRDAFAECSMCRRTLYCSTFCQRKDWTSHQVECSVRTSEQGSIMLIVESATDEILPD